MALQSITAKVFLLFSTGTTRPPYSTISYILTWLRPRELFYTGNPAINTPRQLVSDGIYSSN